MRKNFSPTIDEVIPSVRDILESQGIPHWKQPNGRTLEIVREAVSIFRTKAKPIGVLSGTTREEFTKIFDGEGRNESDSPVTTISQDADSLALFAVTIGEEVCSEISKLFRSNDFVLGSMLDSVASEAAELTAQAVENLYKQQLKDSGRLHAHNGVLRFSPGYCGWHVSGQKKLFSVLRPNEIGITLNDSYLMQPLKSISGVIIAGAKEIFYFDDTFSFCRECTDHSCRERIQAIMDQ